MILTRKCLLVDIFLTRISSKSLEFCEFACVNFDPWFHTFLSLIFFSVNKKAINNIGKTRLYLLAKANVATQMDSRNLGYMKNTKPLQCENFVSNTWVPQNQNDDQLKT